MSSEVVAGQLVFETGLKRRRYLELRFIWYLKDWLISCGRKWYLIRSKLESGYYEGESASRRVRLPL